MIGIRLPGTGNVFYIVLHPQNGTLAHPKRPSHEFDQALLSKSKIKMYRIFDPPTPPPSSWLNTELGTC